MTTMFGVFYSGELADFALGNSFLFGSIRMKNRNNFSALARKLMAIGSRLGPLNNKGFRLLFD